MKKIPLFARTFSFLRILSCAMLAATALDTAMAATGTWSATTGTWNTTATNWTGVSGTPWDSDNGTSNTANFTATSGNATVSGTVYVNGINYTAASGSFAIDSGTINLAGAAPSISVANAGRTLTIGSVLDGTGGLAKSGSGTLTLTGNNTYTGTTTISAGTLAMGGSGTTIAGDITIAGGDLRYSNTTNNQIADTSNVTLTSGTFNLLQRTETINALNMSGGTLNATSTANLTLSSPSSFTGGTVNMGAATSGIISTNGTTTLGNVNFVYNHTGSASASAGLVLGGNISVNDNTTANFTNSNATARGNVYLSTSNRTMTVGNNATLNMGWSVGGAGAAYSLTKDGNGTLVFSGINTYTGTTFINAGNVTLSGGSAMTGAVTLANATGAVLYVAQSEDLGSISGGGANGGNIIIADNQTLTTTYTGTATTFSGVISGNNAGLTKSQIIGSGALTLTGNNTYTGATTITAGTLALSGDGALSDSTAVNITGGSFTINGITSTGETIGSLAGTTGTTVVLGSKTLTSGGNNATTTYSGVISGTGGLAKSGTGALTLEGSNTYTGTTTINSGTLIASGGSAIADTGTVTLANTSGALFSIAGNETVGSLQGGGSSGGNVTIADSQTLTVAETGSQAFSGSIQGSGGLAKTGAGTLSLDGSNTYSGATTISAGTLQIGNGGSVGSLSTSSAITNNASLVFNRINTVTQGADFAAVIGGTGAVTQNGNGTLVLTGNNTFTGALSVQTGTLSIAAMNNASTTGALGNSSTAVTLGSSGTTGTLLYTGATATSSKKLTLATGGAGAINVSDPSAILTLSATIDGSGALTKNGTGTLNLTGSNTYSGGFSLNEGWLQIGSAGNGTTIGSLGTGVITLNGGTLSSNGPTARTINNEVAIGGDVVLGNATNTGALTFAGNVTLGGSTRSLTLGSAATFGGVISGTGGLGKSGSGTLTLTGNNTYTGTTTISAGTLAMGGSGTTIAGDITIAGGELRYSNTTNNQIADTSNVTLTSGTFTTTGRTETINALNMSGGTLNATSNGNLTLSSPSSFTGGTVNMGASNAGIISTNGTTTLGNVNFVYNHTNSVLGAAGLILGGDISVNDNTTANFTNSGTGIGMVRLSATTNATRVMSVGDNATLNMGWTIASPNSLTKEGNGTLVLSGNNTFFWTLSVQRGTVSIATMNDSNTNGPLGKNPSAVILGSSGNTGTLLYTGATGISNGNFTLATDGTGAINVSDPSTTLTLSGVIDGSGALTKNGSGTLTLQGANTFTGNTTINSGTLQAASANALGGTSQIIVNNGGSFLVTAQDAVNDNAAIDLVGGRMAVSGSFNETVGLLTLSANSTIDLAGFTGTLRFGGVGSWAGNFNLDIWNWNGVNRNIVFTDATIPNDLTNYLNRISFYSDSGSSLIGNAFEQGFTGAGGGTEIIAVPEPETYLYALALLAVGVVQYLRRRAKQNPLEGHRPAHWKRMR